MQTHAHPIPALVITVTTIKSQKHQVVFLGSVLTCSKDQGRDISCWEVPSSDVSCLGLSGHQQDTGGKEVTAPLYVPQSQPAAVEGEP